MITPARALWRVSAVALAVGVAPARAEDDPDQNHRDIVVTARRLPPNVGNAPATRAGINAETIAATINAVNVEDTLKYLPSLIVRKRHIGDTQAPVATRTSGLGASARSLIYADGALLSALIGNNNGIASPRWSLVSPQEIVAIEIIHGPFSAAYPGNAAGAVVNITTRLPETLEAAASAGVNVQRFDQYATRLTLPAFQVGAMIGDRFGPLALFASVARVTSDSQPGTYVTAPRPAAVSATGTPASGGFDDVNRVNAPVRVLGASALRHQRQEQFKLKAALDIGDVRLAYVGGLFINDSDAAAQSYVTDAAGQPVFAGALNIDGRLYAVAPDAFSGGVYRHDERHWSQALSATGTHGRVDWRVIGTRYEFAHDMQRGPTTALPTGARGGAGTITRLDGTGWATFDTSATWAWDDDAIHQVSAGFHLDRFALDSRRHATADWRHGGEGALTLVSRGRTRTAALWAQTAWRLVPRAVFTLGGRYEWWKAYDGANFAFAPPISAVQPVLAATRFSPKAALAWTPGEGWTARFSFGRAYRFPTVGELYQIVTTPVPAVPDPKLRPERVNAGELAIEHSDDYGSARLSLFAESVEDALISQTGPLNGTATLATFVQNVDRTRVRGGELAIHRRDVWPRLDLSGSVTHADPRTAANAAFPASIGKLLPTVPRWKTMLVATWRPSDGVSLTAAGRYTSRLYGTLDNSDVVGNTYQGFQGYLVVDVRAQFRVGAHWAVGLGVDNINNDQYFLFHPFPRRSVQADLKWRL